MSTDAMAMDLKGVAKVYKGRVHALRGIEMHVRRGEVFGLLGPNGAGKSTLVKILMTVISPTRCDGHVLGAPVGHKPTLARIGYLPEHHRFPDYLTGAQVLDFYASMAKVPRPERKRRAAELLDLVGMSAWANKRVKGYSKGMRQRIGVAQALMNDPDLVLLDEPTDGVDPVGRRDIRNVLTEMKSRGKTVFINSHLLSEIEMVCDRVAILVQGVVSSQGTIKELTQDQERYEIEIESSPDHDAAEAVVAALPGGFERCELPASHAASLAVRSGYRGTLGGGETIEIDRHTLRIGSSNSRVVQPIIDALRARGVLIRSVRPVRPSLEDLFMQAITDPTTGEVLAPGAGQPGKSKPTRRRA